MTGDESFNLLFDRPIDHALEASNETSAHVSSPCSREESSCGTIGMGEFLQPTAINEKIQCHHPQNFIDNGLTYENLPQNSIKVD